MPRCCEASGESTSRRWSSEAQTNRVPFALVSPRQRELLAVAVSGAFAAIACVPGGPKATPPGTKLAEVPAITDLGLLGTVGALDGPVKRFARRVCIQTAVIDVVFEAGPATLSPSGSSIVTLRNLTIVVDKSEGYAMEGRCPAHPITEEAPKTHQTFVHLICDVTITRDNGCDPGQFTTSLEVSGTGDLRIGSAYATSCGP